MKKYHEHKNLIWTFTVTLASYKDEQLLVVVITYLNFKGEVQHDVNVGLINRRRKMRGTGSTSKPQHNEQHHQCVYFY